MARKKRRLRFENIYVENYAAEGKSVAHIENKTIFIHKAIPEDIVNIEITKNKKDWAEAVITDIVRPSGFRVKPFCTHFGVCGGCKWQILPYEHQALYKKEEVLQNFIRIGKISIPENVTLVPALKNKFYRNNLEYTFSNKTYLTKEVIRQQKEIIQKPAIGFHAPKVFDKVVPIEQCFLLEDKHNTIRNAIRDFAFLNAYTFYDRYTNQGWLRNLRFRWSTLSELMVVLVVAYEDTQAMENMLSFIRRTFPEITSLYFIVNTKKNDSIFDLTPVLYAGNPTIKEQLGDFHFQISPKSFFQTNTLQALHLYEIITRYAEPDKHKIIYDLYCGTGTIAMFLSKTVKSVWGIEIIADAVEDARKNALANGIDNVNFIIGDVNILEKESIQNLHIPKADVVVVNPPRSGLSKQLIDFMITNPVPLVVYTSCNSATQARDLALLKATYEVTALSVVDMFPHTHHIECVAQLKRKS